MKLEISKITNVGYQQRTYSVQVEKEYGKRLLQSGGENYLW